MRHSISLTSSGGPSGRGDDVRQLQAHRLDGLQGGRARLLRALLHPLHIQYPARRGGGLRDLHVRGSVHGRPAGEPAALPERLLDHPVSVLGQGQPRAQRDGGACLAVQPGRPCTAEAFLPNTHTSLSLSLIVSQQHEKPTTTIGKIRKLLDESMELQADHITKIDNI